MDQQMEERREIYEDQRRKEREEVARMKAEEERVSRDRWVEIGDRWNKGG